MKKMLLVLTLSSLAMAAPQRTVPLTPEAQDQIRAVCAGMPSDWQRIGVVGPKSTREIAYSLLGIGGEVLDRDFADFHAYQDYLEPLGAKRIRLQGGWAKTEKERGAYNFTWLDRIVDGSLARHIDPWLELSYGNLLYPGAGGTGLGQGLIHSEEGLAAWDRYVTAALRHFAERVTYYEIWNEADINHRSGKMTEEIALAYPRLFVRTAEIIRREDPDAFIHGLALAGVSRANVIQVFLDYLAEQGKLHLLDGISFHGYPTNPDDDFEHVARMRVMVDRVAPGVVLWQGETGAPSARQPQFALSNRDWSELSQAKWNTRRALAHIGRNIPFSQFQISDMYYQQTKRNTLNTKGLLQTNPDNSVIRPKLAYYTYQHVCSIFSDGLVPAGPLEGLESPHKTLSCFHFHHAVNGRSAYALWDNSDKPGESKERSRISLMIPAFRIASPIYVDLISGAAYAIPEKCLRLRGSAADLQNIPIWDAPAVITDRSLVSLLED